jgi:hypothetical protein
MTTPKRIPCTGTCRGGRPCRCKYIYGEQRHTQHICNNPACICHQPEAWGLRLDGAMYVQDAAMEAAR